MFCYNCGYELHDEKFCPECGARVMRPDEKTEEPPKGSPEASVDADALIAQFGRNKIQAIKYVRDATGCSLRDAKEYVDGAYAGKSAAMISAASSAPKPLTKKERVAENRANAVACCPKCGSTSLSANKKGFGIGKAVIGASVSTVAGLGPLGLVAGNLGAKKVRVTCLNCGHQFWAGKR